MHQNNYYFIRQLSKELLSLLKSSVLYDCYSQNKDELVLAFVLPDRKEFFIVAHLGSAFSSLYFPSHGNRARRNSITLFEEILGEEVLDIEQVENERAFLFEFSGGFKFLFKLFGNRSNIILYKDNAVLKIFKNNLKIDKAFVYRNREVDFSFDRLKDNDFNPKEIFFTFDPLFIQYLESKSYNEKSDQEKYQMIQDLLNYLEFPEYYVTKISGKVVLSLFPLGEILSKHSSPISVINAYYSDYFRYNFLQDKKDKVLAVINEKIKSALQYIEKNQQRLKELEEEKSPSQIADIIMANLHQIPMGTAKVKLLDFYSGDEVEIKLKKDITAQKNAELLYKKAKKKPLEVENLNRQIENKKVLLEKLEQDKLMVTALKSHKDLEPFEAQYQKNSKKEVEEDEKFKVFEVMGFKILVGRNADNNDELTQKYTSKNDLWLHAKDVSGSHVVVKFQSGKKFPKPVIEAAAGLAAYYSKRKNESLCPVIYTEKKYVRKVKGMLKGEVKVEKETVIMVVPNAL